MVHTFLNEKKLSGRAGFAEGALFREDERQVLEYCHPSELSNHR
jgi:hypothetical protein